MFLIEIEILDEKIDFRWKMFFAVSSATNRFDDVLIALFMITFVLISSLLLFLTDCFL